MESDDQSEIEFSNEIEHLRSLRHEVTLFKKKTKKTLMCDVQ